MNKGAAPGHVLQTGPGAAPFAFSGIDCRSALPQAAIEEHRFAYIQFVFGPTAGKYFYSGPKQRHAIVPIPAGVEMAEGNWVYVNIRDCNQPVVRQENTRGRF
jgi:hypothetical protein